MIRRRLAAYHRRIRARFEAAFEESHTAHEIAASFGFGTFVTTLPTLGTGLLLFVAVAYRFDRVSKLALFVPVVVLNPIAKWGVYAASFWLGSRLLGPTRGATFTDVSFSAGTEVALRLLVGNVVLAVVFACVGYVVVHRLVREYRRREIDLVDLVFEEAPE